ncbi:hypothetical protein HDU86_005557 [Geranomyces michiganensis]|nr:hypothetical protein HDU86_005557 [Geranomyces michiganensis]
MKLRLQQILDANAPYPVVPELQAPGAIELVIDDCSSDGSSVDVSTAIGSAIRQSSLHHANGLIGVGYSDPTTAFASSAKVFNLPVCDGGSSAPRLSDKSLYPNFFRTISHDNMAGEAIIGLLHAQAYRQIAVISSLDSSGVGLATSVRNFAEKYGISLLTSQSYLPETGDFKPILDAVEASGATVIVFLGVHVDLLRALEETDRRGMASAGYQWITSDDVLLADVHSLTPKQRDLLNGVWASFPTEGTGQAWDDFSSAWLETQNPTDEIEALPFYSGFYAGCIDAYVWAYDRALRNGTTLADFASNVASLVVPSAFSFPDRISLTGPLALDENGDRVSTYDLYSFNKNEPEHGNGSFVAFGRWSGITEKRFTQEATPVYFAGAAEKPADALEITKEYRYVYKERESIVFKPLSPSFLLTTLMGTAVGSFYPLTMVGQPGKASCAAAVFIIPLSLGLGLGSLLVKTYRLFRIFRSQGFSSTSMKNSRMFVLLGACSGLYLLLSIIWIAVDTPRPQWHLSQRVSRTHEIYDYECRADSEVFQWIFLALSYAYTISLLCYGTFLCWVNRNLPKKFGESKAIGTLFHLCIGCFVLVIVGIFILEIDTSGLSVLKTIATAAVVAATLGILFVKNCYLAFGEKQKNTSAELLATGVGLMSGSKTKATSRNDKDEISSNLAVKSGARNATKSATVFVASKQSFMTVWLPKQLILYGDKGFALIVSSSDGDPTVNSNAPVCHFVLLSEYTCTSQADDAREVFSLKLAHKKDKTASFLIRVESQYDLDDWQKNLAPYARTALGMLSSIGGTSAQRGAVLASALMKPMEDMDEEDV